MKIGVLAEQSPGERRVAISPDSVKAYVRKGASVAVESGAGAQSFISDAKFAEAGASIVTAQEAVKDADIVLTVRRPAAAALAGAKKDALIIGLMEPYGEVSG
ncbi:MAG TPA: NAD(P)(+) transhydrogenase (Re/Si-specific) subunit alpha, partial [Aestuariivirgaceae bacterium]|nr:NAD(P)(+) transhydrogenase (Re/Si-specific) subunit alpha [Aestuariivirgaceae bacterium]